MTSLTEEEARTRWCPHARVAVTKGARTTPSSCNRLQLNGEQRLVLGSLCIASNCMAWRVRGFNGDGYCGLAGGPIP